MTFGLCVRILLRRKTPGSLLYFGCIVLLFILATLFVAMEMFGLVYWATIFFRAAKTREFGAVLEFFQPRGPAFTSMLVLPYIFLLVCLFSLHRPH